MAKKITEDKIKDMIKLYNEGKSYVDISKILNISTDTISKYLKINGITYKRTFDRLTEGERLDICNLYIDNKWEEIFNKYKFMTKNRVYHLVGEIGVKKEKYFWRKEDIDILINNHEKPYKEIQELLNNKYSCRAICAKAIKLGLTNSRSWSDDEINILKTKYSILPKEQFLELLPNRTEASIVCMAMKLNVKSYQYLNEKYTNEEKQFILDNYKFMTDDEIASKLGKPLSGIKEQRRKLGIYFLNKDYSGYYNFTKFFRGHLQEWKDKSMEACDYRCILTGSKNFHIHHLYGLNIIIKETFEKLEILGLIRSDDINDYSKDELDEILKVFHEIHNKYPLGVCIRKDIHCLFHQKFGSGGNNEVQWNKFVINYNNNKYDNELVA